MKIKNIFGEELDVLIEGDHAAKAVIIFVHGFGTDKNEGFATFRDAANYFQHDSLTVRFDLSGYGESGGEDYEFQFQKAAGDVDSVIRYVRKQFPDKKIYLWGHSLGTFVISLLSPSGIDKVVFTAIPNANTEFIVDSLQKRIRAKGGTIDEQGHTLYPRSSGATQRIGKDFWRTLRAFDPVEYIEDLGQKTSLIILKPLQDDVLEYKFFEEYKTLKYATYVEVNGDHNFTKPEDRRSLFEKVKSFLI